MLSELLTVFVPLLVVVDPPASVGLFLGLTPDRTRAERIRIAIKAATFAAGVLALFAAAGRILLEYLGIEIYALQIAGGLLLVMIGLRMLREGREIPRRELREVHLPTGGAHDPDDEEGDPSFVPLGLPMLAGPGAISLVIVQSTNIGLSLVGISIAIVMTLTALFLMAAARMQKLLGDTGTRVITRIMGILTVAFAVQYVLDGLDGWMA
ncbi:MAG: MarC family protein [Thermoplasmatota archaeon]